MVVVGASASVNAGARGLVQGMAAGVGAVAAIFTVVALSGCRRLVAATNCAEADGNSCGRVVLGVRNVGLSGIFSVCGQLGMVEVWGK